MLMEFCERGSLEDMMKAGRFKLPNGQPNLPMIVACLLDIAAGVLSAVRPCHSVNAPFSTCYSI